MKRMVGNLMSLALYFLFLIPMIASPLYSESTRFRLSTTSVLNAKDWAVESNILRDVSGNSLVDRLMYHRYSLMGKALLQNYSENLSLDFLFINGDPNLRHGTGTSGLFLLPFLPFLFIGFYFFYHKSKPHLLLLVVWWLAALLPASVPETTPHALRSLNALLPVSILIGTGLATSIFYLFRKSWLGAAVSAGYIGIILFALVRFGTYYFSSYPETSAPDWQAGFKEMVLAIEMRKDPVRTVWVDVNDDRFYLWQLAYGNYPLLEVQASLKNRHEPDSIQNIRFEPFLWDGIDTLDHKIAIAGTTAEIDEQLEISKLVPQWRENIEVPKGGEPLSVIGIGE